MLTRAVTDSDESDRAVSTLAGMATVQPTVKGRASSHLRGPSSGDMGCYSPDLPMAPTALLAPDKQRNERCPEAGGRQQCHFLCHRGDF